MTIHHLPVLLDDTLRFLDPQAGQVYVDGTAGYGGHAAAVISLLGKRGRAILIDRDANAVRHLASTFGDAKVMHAGYVEAFQELAEDGERVDMILLDLGVSSPQLERFDRGFSFHGSASLDMRMDQSQILTAATVVNSYQPARLEQILHDYGEEKRAKSVARAIVAARPIATTDQLAKIVRRIVGYSGDIDPATRTFQAIRIEVNDELNQLQAALPLATQLLVPGGRLVVISFHSLEDRIVKQFIDRETRDCICPPKQPICTCGHKASLVSLIKRPIKGADNDDNNPRARSAKLRAAAKTKTKQET